MADRAVRVAVLAGGRSPEHDISCESGREVLAHIDRRRWCAIPVFLERGGAWVVPDEGVELDPASCYVDAMRGERLRPGRALSELLDRGVGLVFPALHGRFGEDGTVQGMLELHDVAFVGSGSVASAVGMDKVRTREAFAARGIPMAPAWVSEIPITRCDPDRVAEQVRSEVGFPCFLKTDVSGSTLGVRRADNDEDVRAFVRGESARGVRFLAERAVDGEEISVPILGNSADDELRALPPIGIYPSEQHRFFSYEAKYAAGGAEEVVPPRGLDSEQIVQVQRLAECCHRALWCDGLSRTDIIWTVDGPIVLETNTLPGLSAASLLPKAAAADGLSFTALIDLLLDAALRVRSQERAC